VAVKARIDQGEQPADIDRLKWGVKVVAKRFLLSVKRYLTNNGMELGKPGGMVHTDSVHSVSRAKGPQSEKKKGESETEGGLTLGGGPCRGKEQRETLDG